MLLQLAVQAVPHNQHRTVVSQVCGTRCGVTGVAGLGVVSQGWGWASSEEGSLPNIHTEWHLASSVYIEVVHPPLPGQGEGYWRVTCILRSYILRYLDKGRGTEGIPVYYLYIEVVHSPLPGQGEGYWRVTCILRSYILRYLDKGRGTEGLPVYWGRTSPVTWTRGGVLKGYLYIEVIHPPLPGQGEGYWRVTCILRSYILRYLDKGRGTEGLPVYWGHTFPVTWTRGGVLKGYLYIEVVHPRYLDKGRGTEGLPVYWGHTSPVTWTRGGVLKGYLYIEVVHPPLPGQGEGYWRVTCILRSYIPRYLDKGRGTEGLPVYWGHTFLRYLDKGRGTEGLPVYWGRTSSVTWTRGGVLKGYLYIEVIHPPLPGQGEGYWRVTCILRSYIPRYLDKGRGTEGLPVYWGHTFPVTWTRGGVLKGYLYIEVVHSPLPGQGEGYWRVTCILRSYIPVTWTRGGVLKGYLYIEVIHSPLPGQGEGYWRVTCILRSYIPRYLDKGRGTEGLPVYWGRTFPVTWTRGGVLKGYLYIEVVHSPLPGQGEGYWRVTCILRSYIPRYLDKGRGTEGLPVYWGHTFPVTWTRGGVLKGYLYIEVVHSPLPGQGEGYWRVTCILRSYIPRYLDKGRGTEGLPVYWGHTFPVTWTRGGVLKGYLYIEVIHPPLPGQGEGYWRDTCILRSYIPRYLDKGRGTEGLPVYWGRTFPVTWTRGGVLKGYLYIEVVHSPLPGQGEGYWRVTCILRSYIPRYLDKGRGTEGLPVYWGRTSPVTWTRGGVLKGYLYIEVIHPPLPGQGEGYWRVTCILRSYIPRYLDKGRGTEGLPVYWGHTSPLPGQGEGYWRVTCILRSYIPRYLDKGRGTEGLPVYWGRTSSVTWTRGGVLKGYLYIEVVHPPLPGQGEGYWRVTCILRSYILRYLDKGRGTEGLPVYWGHTSSVTWTRGGVLKGYLYIEVIHSPLPGQGEGYWRVTCILRSYIPRYLDKGRGTEGLPVYWGRTFPVTWTRGGVLKGYLYIEVVLVHPPLQSVTFVTTNNIPVYFPHGN